MDTSSQEIMLLLAGLMFLMSQSFGLQPGCNEHDTNNARDSMETENLKEQNTILHNTHRKKRTVAGKYKYWLWFNNTVPYYWDSSVFDTKQKTHIKRRMKEISHYTCIEFKWKGNMDKDWAHFINSHSSCTSYLGRMGGNQTISLNPMCFLTAGAVLHELLHLIGLHHEHERPDRDKYLDVKKQGVEPVSPHHVQDFGLPYDYRSITHYRWNEGGYKMIPRNPDFLHVIGQGTGMSFLDVRTVTLLYNCVPKNCDLTDADCGFCGFVGKDCRCWCPGPSLDVPIVYCFTDDENEKGPLDFVP